MEKKILVINGHPDPRPERFCAALCESYFQGAAGKGFNARSLTVGAFAPSLISPPDRRAAGEKVSEIGSALGLIRWANQLVLFFPLWLDQAPALLQELFARATAPGPLPDGAHTGLARATSLFVTMEMPAFAHRSLFASKPSADRMSFALPGVADDELTFIGSVSTISADRRARWLSDIRKRGAGGN